MRRITRCLGAALVFLAGVLAVNCAAKSPEEKIAELRGLYSARLNGFILEEEPILPPAAEVEEAEEMEVEAADGAVDLPVEPLGEIEVKQSVRLDILIQHRSEERLPGVTVDISMVDPNQQEKGHWRVWFDTSEVVEATVTQFTHILEDVGYEEGDGFYVEVRHPVPPEERSEYREFSQVS